MSSESASDTRSADEADSSRHITLPADLTIRNAAILRDLLQPALECDGEVLLGAEEVARVDAAGLQVLASFARARPAASLRWNGAAPLITDAARQLALGEALQLIPKSSSPEECPDD